MLVVLILKLKYRKLQEEKQMCLLRKDSFLEWGDEFNDWYILPSITVNLNSYFTISFNWLKIHYQHSWKIVTYEEEDAMAQVHYNLNNKV